MQTDHVKTIIVGGGPAGATCGYLLMKNNQDCLIIDRKEFPREKLCGGGLTPKAHMLLREIFGEIAYDYYDVKEMDVYSRGKYTCSFSLDAGIRTVLRSEFDHTLLKEYQKAGGKVMTATVKKIEEKERRIYLSLDSGKVLSCNCLIGADGVHSTVRKYLEPGFKKGALCLEKVVEDSAGKYGKNIKVYFDRKFESGYLYVFPNKQGYAVGYEDKQTSCEEFSQSLEKLGLTDNSKVKGAYIPVRDKRKYPFRKDIILIGDAGGYADSLTGEGIYYAIRSVQHAASAIISNQDFRTLNQDVLSAMKRRDRMARLFYIRLVNRLFMWMCRKPSLLVRINRRVNRELQI